MLTPFKDEETGDYGYRDGERVVIPPEFDEVAAFEHGVAVARRMHSYGLIDVSGDVLLPFEYDNIYVSGSGDWVHAGKAGTEHLFTIEGKPVLALTGIKWWYYPEDGLIRVKKDGAWGCIDLNGETVIPFVHNALGPVINGRLSFYVESKWGWLDTAGMVKVDPVFDEVGIWDEHKWWGRKDGVYRLYDFEDRLFLDEGWTKIHEPVNGVAIVKVQGAWKFVDQSFNTILQLPPCYDQVRHFHEDRAAVKCEGLWGFIDHTGREVISPQWDKADDFSEGLAAVRVMDRWGYIDTTGKLIIPAEYFSAGPFHDGRALVYANWCEWYIDTKGKAVTDPVYID